MPGPLSRIFGFLGGRKDRSKVEILIQGAPFSIEKPIQVSWRLQSERRRRRDEDDGSGSDSDSEDEGDGGNRGRRKGNDGGDRKDDFFLKLKEDPDVNVPIHGATGQEKLQPRRSGTFTVIAVRGLSDPPEQALGTSLPFIVEPIPLSPPAGPVDNGSQEKPESEVGPGEDEQRENSSGNEAKTDVANSPPANSPTTTSAVETPSSAAKPSTSTPFLPSTTSLIAATQTSSPVQNIPLSETSVPSESSRITESSSSSSSSSGEALATATDSTHSDFVTVPRSSAPTTMIIAGTITAVLTMLVIIVFLVRWKRRRLRKRDRHFRGDLMIKSPGRIASLFTKYARRPSTSMSRDDQLSISDSSSVDTERDVEKGKKLTDPFSDGYLRASIPTLPPYSPMSTVETFREGASFKRLPSMVSTYATHATGSSSETATGHVPRTDRQVELEQRIFQLQLRLSELLNDDHKSIDSDRPAADDLAAWKLKGDIRRLTALLQSPWALRHTDEVPSGL